MPLNDKFRYILNIGVPRPETNRHQLLIHNDKGDVILQGEYVPGEWTRWIPKATPIYQISLQHVEGEEWYNVSGKIVRDRE